MLMGANREGVQGARQSNAGMRSERGGMEAALGRDPQERAQEQRAERGQLEEGERKDTERGTRKQERARQKGLETRRDEREGREAGSTGKRDSRANGAPGQPPRESENRESRENAHIESGRRNGQSSMGGAQTDR